MNVQFYAGAAAGAIWAEVRPLFARLPTSHGDFSTDDLLTLAQSERAVIGVVSVDGKPVLAGAFEFIYYPQLTAVNIVALAGQRMGAAMTLFWADFKTFCQESGAQVIEARCGPGMARLLRHKGFKAVYQIVRLDL